MSVFTRPLVPLSLTQPDSGLLQYASLVLRRDRCEDICFVHVIDDSAVNAPADVGGILARMRSEVEQHYGPPGECRFEVVSGSRLDLILKHCMREQHDVILLGHRHGRSGRRSLARRLASVAPCSVWLIPEDAPDRIANLLVPIDFSAHSADALSFATRIAALHGIDRCMALHVYFDPSSLRYPEHVEAVLANERESFDAFVSGIDTHGVNIEPIFVESTHTAETILRVAKERQVDLVVMNTRGRTRSAAVLLGSVTSETMAATEIPLLAVKHFGSHESLLEVLFNGDFWQTRASKTN